VTGTQQPGSRLVEEIILLLQAVAERAGPWLDRVAASPSEGDSAGNPLSALGALLRGEPSESAAIGLDLAADLVALLRAVLADRWEPDVIHMPGFRPPSWSRPGAAADGRADDRPGDGADGRETATRVQRIPIRRGFSGDTVDA